MNSNIHFIWIKIMGISVLLFLFTHSIAQNSKPEPQKPKSDTVYYSQVSKNDTIITSAVIYNGDTIEAKTLAAVALMAYMTASQRKASEEWTRLRNAVYVTYPYALRAGVILNDINLHLATIPDKEAKRKYIKSREKELKKQFTDPLTNMSIYQGKVLMKLINRETGNNCYNIIKEYKSGLVARVYQTVAFFFETSLKQNYDPNGEDAQAEKFVQEVRRMYGYRN